MTNHVLNLETSAAGTLHDVADVTRFRADSNQASDIVIPQFFQLSAITQKEQR